MLQPEDKKKRDAYYLRAIATGEMMGPLVGYPEIDKTFLEMYTADEILEDLPQRTIWQYLKDSLCTEDDNNIRLLSYYDTDVTWKEFREKVENTAHKLVSRYGVGKGDKISLCLPTIPETFYLFFAVNMIGAIANMIDPRLNAERLKDCIGTDSKVVFAIDKFNEKIDEVTQELHIDNVVAISGGCSLPRGKRILYNMLRPSKKVERFITWKDFMKTKVIVKVLENTYQPGETAAIVFTSGTTGIPKGALLSNDDINAIAFQHKKVFPDKEKGDTFLDIMPPFLAYGLGCGVCAPLTIGLNLILIPEFKPEEFGKLVMQNRPNHILGVPSFFESLVSNEKVAQSSLSYIKYCFRVEIR